MAKAAIEVSFKNDVPGDPAEIRIYEEIGKDPWSGGGFDAKDFASALATIPKNRELHIRINSAGGDVWQGMAIKSLLDEWPAKKRATIDGVAASTASWIPLGCDEVKMAAHAQMFIHDAWGLCAGNAKEMTEMADRLDKTSDIIADMYATKSGASRKSMRDMMREGTLMNGEECKRLGLVDSLTTDQPINNFSPEAISSMRNHISELRNSLNKHSATGKIMTKTQMLALLNKWGVKVPDNATDEQLVELVNAGKPETAPAAPNSELKLIKDKLEQMTEANNAAQKLRITNEVQECIDEDKIPAGLKDKAIARALKDETYLDEIKALPSKPPGGEPVKFDNELKADASPKEVLRGYANFRKPMEAWQRGVNVSMKDLGNASMQRAHFFAKNQASIVAMMNTNTVDSALKRDTILQISIRDFVRRLLALRVFSTVFENVPLEGTNKVQVPFYDLDTSSSTSFVLATGYTTIGNTTTDNREITVGTGASDGDRLFQALSFTSEELIRQPYLKILELTQLKAEKLASDIVADVLGIVTVANFGASAKVQPAAAFSSDDVADMKLACKTWPEMGRGLVLDSAYDAALLKDPAFKFALNAASDSAIKEGRLNPRVMGFDYVEIPTIPSNSENLVGFAVFKSAVLVATAPVPPVEEVRNAGTQYQIVTDPQSGISFEYRQFGDNVTDKATHVVECSYGFAKGNANALKRITSAA